MDPTLSQLINNDGDTPQIQYVIDDPDDLEDLSEQCILCGDAQPKGFQCRKVRALEQEAKQAD